jgi:hypothetical protein
MLLLDDSSASALAIDRRIPESAPKVSARLQLEWPRLAGRVRLIEGDLESVEAQSDDVVISCHACGSLTDSVLTTALSGRARVVVLPCCQSTAKSDLGGLNGWLDPALAIDVTRAMRLREAGYEVRTQAIPAAITPKNRLLLGNPRPV